MCAMRLYLIYCSVQVNALQLRMASSLELCCFIRVSGNNEILLNTVLAESAMLQYSVPSTVFKVHNCCIKHKV